MGYPVGSRLVAGRYALLSELGRGGLGVVWRAQDRVIEREVALKELRIPPGLSQPEHEAFLARALREARTAGRLNDPAVVTVFDVVAEGGAMFIVMELIDAPTLAEVVNRTGPLPQAQVVDLAGQVLAALETAHAAGIVHRDVKPSNIMLLPNGRVKLADFGIAQAMDDPGLTATGGIMGSPGYMAPELFHGESHGPASDLWSLGATLFHLVEGQAPFQRGSTAATMHAIMYDDPRLRRCTGPLATVIMGLLVHNTAERLTAPQVRDLLDPLAADQTSRIGQALLPTTLPSDAQTETMPRIEAGPSTDPERTSVVSRDQTAIVSRRPRSTQPWDVTSRVTPAAGPVTAPDQPSWATNDDWTSAKPERRGRRRVLLLSGIAAVLVVAVVGIAVALAGPTPAAASANHNPQTTGQSASGTSGSSVVPTSDATSTTASSTSGSASTTPTTTSRTGTSSAAAGGPATSAHPGSSATTPPTSTTPALEYVLITRYHTVATTAPTGHFTTTGSPAPPKGFTAEGALGRLVKTNAPGTIKFYLCRLTSGASYFSSTDQTGRCGGQTEVALLGYLYTSAPAGIASHPLYLCGTSTDKFDSTMANCEGAAKIGLSGYLT